MSPRLFRAPVIKMLFRPQRHLTLANFQRRRTNQHARAYALSLALGSPRKLQPVLIVASQPGRGKSHLIHAVGNFAKQNASIETSSTMSARQLIEVVHKGVAYGDLHLLGDQLRDNDFLAIDDVDQLADEDIVADFILPILQQRLSAGKVTLLSATLGFARHKTSGLSDFLGRQLAVYLG